MAKAVNPSRMNFRIELGGQGDTETVNPNTGEAVQGFIPVLNVWAGKWSLTTSQNLSLAGAGVRNTVAFFVRHNESIDEEMQIRYKDEVYQIDSITFDEGIQAEGFDIITCHKWVNNHA